MKQSILIGTTSDVNRSPWLNELVASLYACPYDIHIVGTNDYELSAMKLYLTAWQTDEFVFLPHSMIVKDLTIFDTAFKENAGKSVSLCQTPEAYGMYIGKYRTSVIRRIGLPEVKTKFDAVRYETVWTRQYVDAERGNLIAIGDMPASKDFEEKNGRLNMVVENEFFKKWKGSWDGTTMAKAEKERA